MKTMQRLFCTVVISILSVFVLSFYTLPVSAYTTISAEIPVFCLEIPDDETHLYRIKIESENEISPVPKSDLLEITDNGTGKFEIDINEPGTFAYRVYEIAGDEEAVQYDTNVYSVTVFAENMDETGLRYAVTAEIIGQDGKQDRIAFGNTIEKPPVPETTEPTAPATEPTTHSAVQITTAVTTAATAVTTASPHPIIDFIGNVMTGDFTPVHSILTVLIGAAIVTLAALLLRHRDSGEPEE